MKNVFNLIKSWSFTAFPDATPENHLRKALHEINEAIQVPNDKEEYADITIALFSAVSRAGISYDEYLSAIEHKLKVNEKRKWKRLSDGTHQHVNS